MVATATRYCTENSAVPWALCKLTRKLRGMAVQGKAAPELRPCPFPSPLICVSLLLLTSLVPAGALRMGHVAAFQSGCTTRPSPTPPPAPACAGAVKTVIVIGAGISGVSAAHNLTLTDPCFKVWHSLGAPPHAPLGPRPVCTGAVRTATLAAGGMPGVSAAHNLNLTDPCPQGVCHTICDTEQCMQCAVLC